MIRFTTRRGGAALLAIACVTGMAACSSTSSSSSSAAASAGAVKSGGTLTYALDEDIAGFNVLQADDNEFVLNEILDQVWPSVYTIQPNLSLSLNTNIVTSATETSTNPQTMVYQINPKATWSDGVPFNAAGLHLQLAGAERQPEVHRRGRQGVPPASTAGYSLDQVRDQLQQRQDRDRGLLLAVQRLAVAVRRRQPMIPAHIAEKVGFNSGFQNFGPRSRCPAALRDPELHPG